MGINFMNGYEYLMEGNGDERPRLFSVAPTNRTRGNRHKLKHMKFHLNTRMAFFIVRVVKNWNRLPREVMTCPYGEIFQT